MQHLMNLKSGPFESIKAFRKTVEMRLFDEKRQTINVGDSILFKNVSSGEQLLVEVVDLQIFPSFVELYAHYDKIAIGYNNDDIAHPDDMLDFYSADKIAKYGVVAITIKVG